MVGLLSLSVLTVSWLVVVLHVRSRTIPITEWIEPPPPLPPTPLPAVDVVWSDADPYLSSVLLGVDEDKHQALIRRDRLYKTERWMIDTIDLGTGTLVDRWEATPTNAHAWLDLDREGAFHAVAGPFQPDLARYATMLRATRGNHTDEHFAVSEGNVLYATNDKSCEGNLSRCVAVGGFTTWLADEAGRNPRRLASTFASYAAFSPDGKWVTFLGCKSRCSMEGYTIFVARVDGGPVRELDTRHVPGQKDGYSPYTMAWSPKGELLVLDWPDAYGSHAPDCVLRYQPETPTHPEIVVCMPGPRAPESGNTFLVGTGNDRVLAGWDARGSPVHYTWLSITDGALKADGLLPADVKGITPWAQPRLGGKTPTVVAVADDKTTNEEELVLLDPTDPGKAKRLKEGRWRTAGAQGMWWLDDDRLLALRAVGTTTQLVVIHRDRLK